MRVTIYGKLSGLLFLEGDPQSLALDAFQDLSRRRGDRFNAFGDERYDQSGSDEEIEDRNGNLIDRTQAMLKVNKDATVGELNAALRSVGASIVHISTNAYDWGSPKNEGRVRVKIPDPGSLEALELLLQQRSEDPAILWGFAYPYRPVRFEDLPPAPKGRCCPGVNEP